MNTPLKYAHRAPVMSRLVRTSALAVALVAVPAAMVVTGSTSASASGGTTYYVSANGSDSASGTSAGHAWRSLSRVPAGSLKAGDRVLLQRRGQYEGQLNISSSGTSANNILVGAYGKGARPKITKGNCLEISGNNVTVKSVRTVNCNWSGISVGGKNITVTRSRSSQNVTGIFVRSGADSNRIIGNQVTNNRRMSVNTKGGDDDSGAFGILVNGDNTEIANNKISGHHAFSYDYGVDGAAVEIYGAIGTKIHHNIAKNNKAFTELGNKRSKNTTYSYNAVTSNLKDSEFLVTRGAGSNWGPILNTDVTHNTVKLNGAGSQGFVCYDGCGADILSLRENVISASWKVGYADHKFDTQRNIFWGGQVQFEQGKGDRFASPQFQSNRTHDVSVDRSSPVVDAGSINGWDLDVIGQNLPADGNQDGVTSVDIGAFERH